MAKILKPLPKRFFDVTNKKDLDIFKSYLVKSAWGKDGCPFEIEEPFVSIPDMIKDKLVRKFLRITK
jgi:hypothetical protein